MILSQLDRLPRPPAPIELARQLPVLAARSTALVPFGLQKTLIIKVLQEVFREALDDGDFDFLADHCMRISISDAQLSWYLTLDQGHLQLIPHAEADASISGNLYEFILLASRKEDPDTLFFQRRLVIEGDTEIGLEMKNVMDNIDLDALPPYLRKALDGTAEILRRLQR
ncbi:SCP2 sterol-binding domain-containing protein [Aestuariirhabdus sp. Z084]|uniref:ubiquinone anaerobic biosynthesis accessory factor UbiT n=1 Tax=Aestuariirhabdus haliotis TaxID=2918751 RepID=UPI00201B438D|nr:SCP2 sterol-binding domain-containing protein [Aestuariirhabdus haliotis]MCL6415386.1 SCP2 sterol-binding domain-containing protein [Aestuariirhabdus haliotis]MCL6419142.1 SCP2 sterol-binding domain-containing protein [Aestuariirhabdus haliotis]